MEIYGETTVDDDFVNSIADRGILQPLLVSSYFDREDAEYLEKGYVAIAGHRRRLGAEKAGLESVPCIFKEYDDFNTESVIDLIFSNKTREKTKQQKAAQINALQQILCQAAQLKVKYKSFANEKGDDETLSAIAEKAKTIPELVAFFEGEPLNSMKIIAEKTGMNKSEVEKYIAVCSDESFEKFRAKLEKEYSEFANVKFTNFVIENLQANRDKLFKEEISLDAAYNNVRAYKQKIIEDFEKKKNPQSKTLKPKNEKPKNLCPHCGKEI